MQPLLHGDEQLRTSRLPPRFRPTPPQYPGQPRLWPATGNMEGEAATLQCDAPEGDQNT